MLSRRLISAFCLIGVLIACVFFSQGKGVWLTFVGAHLMVGIALKEYFDLVKAKGLSLKPIPSISVGLLLSAVIFWGSFSGSLTADCEILLLFLTIGLLFLIQAVQGSKGSPLVLSALSVTGVLYIAWLFSFFYKIAFFPGLDGRWFIFFAFLVTKSSDIVAYFVGSLMGKKPLAPKISPKKTREGAIGGLLGSIGAAYLGQALFFPNLELPHLFVFGLVVGVVGIVGDLLESLFKRDAKIKDSGSFIPGMGGAFDVLDSLLFTAPITYFYMKYFVS